MEIAWLGPKPNDQDMSDALDKYFIMSMPNQLDTTYLPLVVMGQHAADSASALKDVFQTYHNNNQKIILIDATPEQLNAVLNVVETNKIPRQPGGNQRRAHWMAYEPDSGAARTYSHHSHIGTDESKMDGSFKNALELQIQHHAYQSLTEFISGDTAVNPSVKPGSKVLDKLVSEPGKPVKLSHEQIDQILNQSDQFDAASTDILAEVAYLYSNTTIYYVYYNDDLTECDSDSNSCASKAEDYPYAKYTVAAYGYTAHSYESDDDYWLFLLNLTLSQSTAMVTDASNDRYYFSDIYQTYNVFIYDILGETDSYRCDNIWKFDDDEDDTSLYTCNEDNCGDSPADASSGLVPMVTEPGIGLIESSPTTISDCVSESVTSSTASSISGTVGFADNTGQDTITSGISNETSNSYTTDAVCVNNYSGADSWNQVNIQFDITKPGFNKNDWGCYKSIDSCSGDATGTFQPWVAWVWKTTDDVRTSATNYNQEDDVNLMLCGGLQYKWNRYRIHKSCSPFDGKEKKEEDWWTSFFNYHLVITFPPNDQE